MGEWEFESTFIRMSSLLFLPCKHGHPWSVSVPGSHFWAPDSPQFSPHSKHLRPLSQVVVMVEEAVVIRGEPVERVTSERTKKKQMDSVFL